MTIDRGVAMLAGCACALLLAASSAFASFIYPASQTAPVPIDARVLASILDQRGARAPYADLYGMSVRDPAGRVLGLAPLKVVQTDNAAAPYLGLYHAQVGDDRFVVRTAASSDLLHWRDLGPVDDASAGDYASQPDLRVLPDDSVLVAEEYHPSAAWRPEIRVRYYGRSPSGQTGLAAFLAAPMRAPSRDIVLPHDSLFSAADGTPEFGRIDYAGSIARSRIELTHHFFRFAMRDMEAAGTLSDFRDWSGGTDDLANEAVSRAGGSGKIGDREVFQVGGRTYELVEAQVAPDSRDDFSAWRLFLVDRSARTARALDPKLAGGARSLGNPTVTFLELPNGAPALAFTCFVFSEGHGQTPPGGHLYVYPLR